MPKKPILTILFEILGVDTQASVISYFVRMAKSHLRSQQSPYCPYRVLDALHVPLVFRNILDEGFTTRAVDLVIFDKSSGHQTEKIILTHLAENPFVVVLRKNVGRMPVSTQYRRRFTVAHELAHVLIRTAILKHYSDYSFPVDDRDEEDLCNAIASEFLVPSGELLNDLEEGGMHCDSLRRLSRTYAVSITCLLRKTTSVFAGRRYAAGIYNCHGDNDVEINYIAPTTHRWVAHGPHARLMSEAAWRVNGNEPLGKLVTIDIGDRSTKWYCESMRLGEGSWILVVFADPDGLPLNNKVVEKRLDDRFGGKADEQLHANLDRDWRSSGVLLRQLERKPTRSAPSPAFAFRRRREA